MAKIINDKLKGGMLVGRRKERRNYRKGRKHRK